VAIQAVVSVVDHGDGTFTATCTGAVDNADNQAAAVSLSYTVVPHATPGGQVVVGRWR
jgi:hypothetical protein